MLYPTYGVDTYNPKTLSIVIRWPARELQHRGLNRNGRAHNSEAPIVVAPNDNIAGFLHDSL